MKLKGQTAGDLEATLSLYPAGGGACKAPPPPGPGEEPCLPPSVSAHKGQAVRWQLRGLLCPWRAGGPAPPDLCAPHPRSHPTFTFTFRSVAFCAQGQFLQLAIWGLEASPGHTLEAIRIKQVVKPLLVTHARIYNL